MRRYTAVLALGMFSFFSCKKEEPRYCYECIKYTEYFLFDPKPSAPYEICDKTQKEIDEYIASKYLMTETYIYSVKCNRK